MTGFDLDPELERLGDALRASTTIDLAREERPARADLPEPGRARRPRRRVLAGGTLGLAGIAAAVLLALGGTNATSPAFAVTRQADGTVLLHVNVDTSGPWLQDAERTLAAMGIDERIAVSYQPGPAPVSGPVTCTPWRGATVGPPLKVLFGSDGTQVIPSGNTGAGTTVHLADCVYWQPAGNGTGNTGNTGTG